jgi:Lactonase, 7-bladed beta-propeller
MARRYGPETPVPEWRSRLVCSLIITGQPYYPKPALSAAQTLATLPSGFTARNTCSQIHLAPSGRFLYVGNRGHNSIAGFAVDPATGHLTPAGRAMTRPISAALSSNKTVNTVGSLLRRTASSQPSRPR